jgi:hypothetical protein
MKLLWRDLFNEQARKLFLETNTLGVDFFQGIYREGFEKFAVNPLIATATAAVEGLGHARNIEDTTDALAFVTYNFNHSISIL